ncbi:CTP synthase [Bifidobacterium amazonense]|uniref:CTP synthase n=1 Tax=Bifidobacterium amazonense TaxID=2809027 RepID=A0ABS9VTP3_9BIFI|nr:CTP synthase [Bifidobacterium amazonense]MCH9275455.1 CTP synthase [Bifidobacterium amazonense]
MKAHHRINRLLADAHRDGRCAIPQNDADLMALSRRVRCGQVIRPRRGLYADATYWNGLNPAVQAVHMARTLSLLHPGWVFAGPTAAAIHGFDHQWSIHHPGLYVADSVRGSGPRCGLNYISMSSIPSVVVGDVTVTSVPRTLVDCGLLLPFGQALAIFDSALLRAGVTKDEVREICNGVRRDCTPVGRLLDYADPRSENGGESLLRAVIVEDGFMVPVLQHVFVNPNDPNEWYRVDFVWFLRDGRIIVAEYDGMAKYTDPAMTDRQSIRTVVNRQARRERALLTWGKVDVIVRVDYDDVVRRTPVTMKLTEAGVPRAGRPF